MSPMEGPGASSFAFRKTILKSEPRPPSIMLPRPTSRRMGHIPFLAGRDFSTRDQAGSPVAIINETTARDCFGNENPIGRHNHPEPYHFDERRKDL